MTTGIDHERLLGQTRWLRRLALELAGDPHRAEDLVQQTWLAALGGPADLADEERRLRAWLRGVVRRLAALARRGEANRYAREQACARPEAQPPVEESLRRAALQQQVLEAVMALEPTQREVVVLHYLDELPPRTIALRIGIPAGAVRTRLHRARSSLRDRLRLERDDERRAWGLTFAAAARTGAGTAPALGSLIMKTQTVLVVLAASLTSVAGVLWWTSRDPGASPPAGNAAPLAEALPAALPAPALIEAPRSALTEVRRESAAPPPAQESAASPQLRGRVVSTRLVPVAEVGVRFESIGEPAMDSRQDAEVLRARSDREGAFALPFPGLHGRLVTEDEAFVTLLDATVGLEPPAETLVLVVAPRCDYAGVVVDEGGTPLADLAVHALVDPALLRGLRPGVPRSELQREWWARTDALGAFELERVGWCEGLRATVDVVGYEAASVELPAHSAPDLRLVLRRPASTARSLAGRVLDPEGTPVADALVWAEESAAQSDHEGRFVLDVAGVDAGAPVHAAARGFLPAEGAVPLVLGPATEEAFVLRLGGLPLAITGRVVDPQGDTVAGAHVWIQDGTRLPDHEANPYRTVEEVLGFGDALESNLHRVTGEDGSFELSGLLPRAYTPWAVHPATLEVVSAGQIEAGSEGIVLAFTGTSARRVAGRVTSYSGEPMPAVALFAGRRVPLDGTRVSTPLQTERSPRTDAEGRFEFAALHVEGTYLLPSSPETSYADRIALDPNADLEHLEIRLPRRCLFQLLLADPDEADALQVLDADGNRLTLTVEAGLSALVSGGMTLAGGRSEVIVTDERAATIVLRRQRQEVRRIPVRLVPGEVQVLRY